MTYYDTPPISSHQRQIIIGTILGGSSIVKPKRGRNCYLLMRDRDHFWIAYKTTQLTQLTTSDQLQRRSNSEAATIRWHSSCYPIFNEFRELFYKNGKKKLTPALFDKLMLRDIGLAVWYGDSGQVRDGIATLKTHQFGKSGSKIIANYFQDCGIDCKTVIVRDSWRVVMTEKGTLRYIATIGEKLPDFILGRIHGI